MTLCGQTNDVLEKCIQDILSVIKPVDDDRELRLGAMKELRDSISSVETVAAVRPFGSFVSNLYAKSGDLDISVELQSDLGVATSKDKKLDVLEEVQKALQIKGIYVEFIRTAKVPILHYVSSTGIPCDVSVDNYPGRIKSRVFFWMNTLDCRFRDMVLLVKEWAKAQSINDPKNGTLNSYSLCLLVVFHFQTCKPAILPPLKEIYDDNIRDASAYDEKHLDKMFPCTNTTHTAISTFEGRLQLRTKFSSNLLVKDPFERPGNAARAVTWEKIYTITSAFNRAKSVFVLDGHRDELLSLLCTPEVGKMISVREEEARTFIDMLIEEEDLQEEDHLHLSDNISDLLQFLHISEDE